MQYIPVSLQQSIPNMQFPGANISPPQQYKPRDNINQGQFQYVPQYLQSHYTPHFNIPISNRFGILSENW